MNSNEKINDAAIPMTSRNLERKPTIVTKTNDIKVTAPAVFKLNLKPVNIAEKICAAPESSFI